MMKYTAVALLALVALAAAGPVPEENEIETETPKKASVWRLFPADEAETSKIKPGFEAASDFCVASRDHVKNYIVGALNSGASTVFTKLFDAFNEVTQEALDAQKKAAIEGSELIKNGPMVEVPPTEEGGEPGRTPAFTQAIRTMFFVGVQALTNKSKEQVTAILSGLKGENAREHILDACATIQMGLKRDLEGQWSQFKKANSLDLKGSANQIGCVTVGRIYTVDNVCSLLNAAKDAIFPIFGM